jgi:hypothetical protein
MSEEDKRNRKFQYALTKAQVDFEFGFALTIGILAIGYALLSYYKDNLLASIVTDGLLLVTFLSLVRVYNLKERKFKEIKQKFIDS